MREAKFTLANELGLHARAAAKLVRLVRRFNSSVIVTREDTGSSADARSLLDILYLSAGKGVELKFICEGDDEDDVLVQINKLFAEEFGEVSAAGDQRSTQI